MTKQEAIRRLYELIADINAEEVADHIRDGVSLQDWTNVWRCAAKDALRVLEDTADTPQTETHDLRTDTHECVSDTPQTETSKTIPLNEWLSFKEYVLEMDGEGGPRIFRIIPMSEYKLQNQELHTDCGWK